MDTIHCHYILVQYCQLFSVCLHAGHAGRHLFIMIRVAFLILILGLAAGVSCSRQQPTAAPAASRYAAAGSCAACHPAQAKSYAQTGMARAFARAAPAVLDREDFANHATY